jgi:hypothetical protein
MREMVENCGKWWKMGPMLKIGGKWCMEHGPNGVWNMDQNGGKLGPNGVWNMVQNGGKLWKRVGNLWEMIQNVRPTMLPLLFSDMSCVAMFHVGLCVPRAFCVTLFESGEFGKFGESGDSG